MHAVDKGMYHDVARSIIMTPLNVLCHIEFIKCLYLMCRSVCFHI